MCLDTISEDRKRLTNDSFSIVDHVASSAPAVQLADNKIRVVSFSGANILTSAGEPVLLGNILLVPETPTMKLQVRCEIQISISIIADINVLGVPNNK